MTLPKNPFKFGVSYMTLKVYDTMREFGSEWTPFGVLAPLCGSDYYGTKSALEKLVHAGICEANRAAWPVKYRIVEVNCYDDMQRALIARFEEARPALNPQKF